MTKDPVRETVLVVDDNEAVLRVLAAGMELEGYNVLRADTGAEALEIAASSTVPIDLVVSDIVMPGIDGRELFHLLRERFPGIRFIFLSGQLMDSGTDISADGLTAFLPKPVAIESLLGFMRMILDARVTRP